MYIKSVKYTNGRFNIPVLQFDDQCIGLLSQILEVCAYNSHTSRGVLVAKGPGAATLWLISLAEIELVTVDNGVT